MEALRHVGCADLLHVQVVIVKLLLPLRTPLRPQQQLLVPLIAEINRPLHGTIHPCSLMTSCVSCTMALISSFMSSSAALPHSHYWYLNSPGSLGMSLNTFTCLDSMSSTPPCTVAPALYWNTQFRCGSGHQYCPPHASTVLGHVAWW